MLGWAGNIEAGLLPLGLSQLVLPTLILWAGAWAALRPGGLVPSPFWRQGWVAALAALLFLGGYLAAMVLPFAETLLVSRLAPLEVFADHVARQSVFGSASGIVRALTFACLFLILAVRLAQERRCSPDT